MYGWYNGNSPSNHLTLDLKSLNLPVGTKVIAEEVSANAYGEVVWIKETSEEGQLSFELPAQSVMLLTIPICSNATKTLVATADATVKAGANSEKNFGKAKVMNIEMNASRANGNQVSYLKFDLSGMNKEEMMPLYSGCMAVRQPNLPIASMSTRWIIVIGTKVP